jgi:hypothetical protein
MKKLLPEKVLPITLVYTHKRMQNPKIKVPYRVTLVYCPERCHEKVKVTLSL